MEYSQDKIIQILTKSILLKQTINMKLESIDFGYIFNLSTQLWYRVGKVEIKKFLFTVVQTGLHKECAEMSIYQNIMTGIGEIAISIYKYLEYGVDIITDKMLALFIDEEFCAKIDQHKHLIPMSNNEMMNLKTGLVNKRTRGHYITYRYDVSYIGDITFAEKYFSILVNGDKEKYNILQRLCGYIITGETIWGETIVFTGDASCYCLMSPHLIKYYTLKTCKKSVGFKSNVNVIEGAKHIFSFDNISANNLTILIRMNLETIHPHNKNSIFSWFVKGAHEWYDVSKKDNIERFPSETSQRKRKREPIEII